MYDLERELSDCRPYPELSLEHLALVLAAFERQPPLTKAEMAFATDLREGDVERAIRLGLIREVAFRVHVSTLGLLYIDSERARQIRDELHRVLLGIAALYVPGRETVSIGDVFAGAGVPVDRVDALQPFLDELHFARSTRVAGLLLVHPSNIRRGGLPEAIARWPRDVDTDLSDSSDDPAIQEPPGEFHLRWTGIEAQNFRALRNLRLDVASPLTVLVGTNGAGKSSVLDVPAFLANALVEGLPTALASENGFERLRTRGADGPISLRARFDADLGVGRQSGTYGWTLAERHGAVFVDREELSLEREGVAGTWLDRRRGTATVRTTDGTLRALHPRLDDTAAGALERSGKHDVPIVSEIARDLGRVLLVDRDPQFAGTARGRTSNRRRTRWSASIDAMLDAAIRDEDAVEHLGDVLRALVPTVRSIRRIVRTGERARFEVIEVDGTEPARIDELSSGTRQMLLLAAVHVHPEPPSLLLVEEPDGGLHVGALPALRDLLRSIARRTTVLATSHSPAFVALLDPKTEVVVVERDERGVRTLPLDDARRSRRWLAAFDPGAESFVRMGMEKP